MKNLSSLSKLILFAICALAVNAWAQSDRQPGLNQYCDPLGTMYMGGTPLFNESTGTNISLEDYLKAKGLDLNCRKLGADGKAKKLNQYCDPLGTMYTGGTPLFNESTGKSLSLEEYLKAKGLDIHCNEIAKNKQPKKPNADKASDSDSSGASQ